MEGRHERDARASEGKAMMKRVKFYGLNIILFLVLTIGWFISSFLLGYANSSNRQGKIWTLYIATIVVHFFIIYLVNRKYYNISYYYVIVNFILYFIVAYYSYYYT
jgi:hypothetical protein